MSTQFKIGDIVTYTDRNHTRIGEIVDIRTLGNKGEVQTRARVRWRNMGKNLRTWIRVRALVIVK